MEKVYAFWPSQQCEYKNILPDFYVHAMIPTHTHQHQGTINILKVCGAHVETERIRQESNNIHNHIIWLSNHI